VFITLSTAFVFALITALLIRANKVTVPTAVFVWLSGFTVAGTGLAHPVNTLLANVITTITRIH
jgi:hypothetical protein